MPDVDLYYEAAVAGAIPILRPIRESLAGDDVRKVLGIVNGTTNFVLDKMDTTGAGFAETVEQAQALGYAEADPTADVEGFDAAAKAAILASLAFHTRVSSADVHREGITEVTRRHPGRQGDGLRRQAARDLRAGDQRRRFGCRERARPPGDDPAQPPARRRPGCLQRGLRRGHRCRAADVLRPRRRGRPDGIRRPR
jgi:homoserine dehydrogenase